MSVPVAFLQGIAGGFLVVLFLALVVGGLLLAVLGGGPGRRTDRAGVPPRGGLILGRVLCAAGLGFAAVGAFFVSVGTDVVGMLLGATGYFLGARVFGVVTIVLATLTLFIGLLAGQGAIPGSYDELLDGFVPRH